MSLEASRKANHPHSVLVTDMENKATAITYNGDTPVTFANTFDIALFIVVASDLEKWSRELQIISDIMAFS